MRNTRGDRNGHWIEAHGQTPGLDVSDSLLLHIPRTLESSTGFRTGLSLRPFALCLRVADADNFIQRFRPG